MANVLRCVLSSLPVSSSLRIDPTYQNKNSDPFFIRVGAELY